MSKTIGNTEPRPPRPPQPSTNPDESQSPRTSQPQKSPLPPSNIESAIPIKYLSSFWRSLDLPLMNSEAELNLSWTKDCALIGHHNNITGLNFMITSTKLYVPVATLSINDKIKLEARIQKSNILEQI